MRRRYDDEQKRAGLDLTIFRLERLSDPRTTTAIAFLRELQGCTFINWNEAAIAVRRLRDVAELYTHELIWAFAPFSTRANDLGLGLVRRR